MVSCTNSIMKNRISILTVTHEATNKFYSTKFHNMKCFKNIYFFVKIFSNNFIFEKSYSIIIIRSLLEFRLYFRDYCIF